MAEKLRRQIKRSCEEKGRGEKRVASAHELGAGRKGERPGKAGRSQHTHLQGGWDSMIVILSTSQQ